VATCTATLPAYSSDSLRNIGLWQADLRIRISGHAALEQPPIIRICRASRCAAGEPAASKLSRQWRSNVANVLLGARSEREILLPRCGEAQSVIRTAPHLICIWVILTVVLPEAHLANLVAATLGKREVVATRTTVGAAFDLLPDTHHEIPSVWRGGHRSTSIPTTPTAAFDLPDLPL
jgi:hypothetical protein